MDILTSHTLRKVAVADVERNRSASKSNPGDSKKAHWRDSQITHTCVKHVSGVHSPLYKGKKGIVVWSTPLNGKSSDKTEKAESLKKLNYIVGQIMEQFPELSESSLWTSVVSE